MIGLNSRYFWTLLNANSTQFINIIFTVYYMILFPIKIILKDETGKLFDAIITFDHTETSPRLFNRFLF